MRLLSLLAALALALPAPALAQELRLGAQVAQGISEFGIGGNNRGKLGGLIVDYRPPFTDDVPFVRHMHMRLFTGLATTKNLASGEKWPILALQPGLRLSRGPVFTEVYPWGIAYAPNPASGSPYQFVFEAAVGIHAHKNVDVMLFWKHLSNGDTMLPNPGLDTWGLGITMDWDAETRGRGDGK